MAIHSNRSMDVPARWKALPGAEGLWYFILADLTLFGLLFGSFSYERSLDVGAFDEARRTLLPVFALVNTLLLLTSSYLMVQAVRVRSAGDRARGAGLTAAAATIGLVFVLIKIAEYTHAIAAGHVPTSSAFFTYYFIITAIHLLHVLGGIILLVIVALRLNSKKVSSDELLLLESGASFWHMVDLLWLIIFPMLYLLR